MKKNEKGFSIVEILIVLGVIGLIGGIGWYVWQSQHKATTQVAEQTKDVYEGWKTYTSILNSGLSFRYPADWVLDPPTKPFTNNNGGTEGIVSLSSVEPVLKPGPVSMVATNQYMCIVIDEYSGNGWSNSNWNKTDLISSEPFQSNGKSFSIDTYKGDSPMQSQLLLTSPVTSSHGDHYVDTKNGNTLSVDAEFNCGQGGPPGIKDLNADFASQPETAVAKLIIKSIKF